MVNRIHAERLVPLDMPDLEVNPNQPRRLEIYDNMTREWDEAYLEQFALDGQVLLRFKKNPQNPEWSALAKRINGWLVG